MMSQQDKWKWTDEELKELHSTLWAFLSFINGDVIRSIDNDETIQGHIFALKKSLDEMLDSHGGRSYY